MKVSIIGAGNAGTGLAAVAASRGHDVCIWSRSFDRNMDGSTRTIDTTGKVQLSAKVRCDSDIARAIDGAELVLICVPAYAQKQIVETLGTVVSANQMIVFSPAPSLGPLLMTEALEARSLHNIVAGTATSLLTAKLQSDTEVQITTMRAGVGLATARPEDFDVVCAALASIFGISFVRLQSILALALAYVTPPVHSAMVLCNISRVELEETWGQFECTTPAVARLCEALDAERMKLAKHFKLDIPNLVEHCVLSFGIPATNYYDFCLAISRARNGGPPGPTSLKQRYVSEDLPYGLVFFSALARRAGISMPLTDSCIELMSVTCDRDFKNDNDFLESIGTFDMLDSIAY